MRNSLPRISEEEVEAELRGGGWALGVCGGCEGSNRGNSLNLLSRLLSKERVVGFLVVNSDLAPKFEGGAEKQKEP